MPQRNLEVCHGFLSSQGLRSEGNPQTPSNPDRRDLDTSCSIIVLAGSSDELLFLTMQDATTQR